MSKLPEITQTLAQLEKPFGTQNQWGLKFESECLFARQQLMKNNYVLQAAQNRPDALRSAILNVAAIGISLNPATAHAYLVPRDGVICLDISYRGLVKLATDSGSIQWAKAVLVYEGDHFRWRGPAQPPEHEADVFAADRIDASDPLKNLKGGYCLARLASGEYMVDVMTAGEILAVRDASKAKNGPWSGSWAGEMAKKTLVKRASKSWPQSARVDTAVHVLNAHEGLDDRAPVDESKIHRFMDLVAGGNPIELLAYTATLSDDEYAECFNAAPKGEKTKLKDRVRQMQAEGNALIADYALQITELAEAGDPAALDLLSELTPLEHEMVSKRITDITTRQITALQAEAA